MTASATLCAATAAVLVAGGAGGCTVLVKAKCTGTGVVRSAASTLAGWVSVAQRASDPDLREAACPVRSKSTKGPTISPADPPLGNVTLCFTLRLRQVDPSAEPAMEKSTGIAAVPEMFTTVKPYALTGRPGASFRTMFCPASR